MTSSWARVPPSSSTSRLFSQSASTSLRDPPGFPALGHRTCPALGEMVAAEHSQLPLSLRCGPWLRGARWPGVFAVLHPPKVTHSHWLLADADAEGCPMVSRLDSQKRPPRQPVLLPCPASLLRTGSPSSTLPAHTPGACMPRRKQCLRRLGVSLTQP